MATFAENIFQVFDGLRSKHRFVPAWAGAGARFAALVRQETDDVFVYVLIRDGRPGGGNLDVDIWVAPPEEPGDSLDRLYVGYKIRIGSEFEIDDAFFDGCEKRIIHFLPCVTPMVPVIREELKSPGIRTKRWTVYQMERQVLEWTISQANAGDPLAVSAMMAAENIVHRNSLTTLEKKCLPIAVAILQQNFLDDGILSFYEGRAESLASILAHHLYVRALGEASVACIP